MSSRSPLDSGLEDRVGLGLEGRVTSVGWVGLLLLGLGLVEVVVQALIEMSNSSVSPLEGLLGIRDEAAETATSMTLRMIERSEACCSSESVSGALGAVEMGVRFSCTMEA